MAADAADAPKTAAAPASSGPGGRVPMSPVAEIARRHDPDRFLCALFAPPGLRESLFALIAYNHELARAREVATQPLAALIRLQWWREAVEEAAEGARPARRHEVATPLHAEIRAGRLDSADLIAMADAREAEAEEGGIPSRAAFDAYLRGTAGGFAVAAGRLLGASGASLVALQTLGAAYGLAGVLRAVPLHAAAGRCLLPADLLAAHGTNAETLLRDPGAAPVRAAARELAEEGRRRLAEARASSALRDLPRGAVAAALPAVLAARDLRRPPDTGRPPAPRGLGDRLAVAWAGLRGRI